jgi:hypothetical protein
MGSGVFRIKEEALDTDIKQDKEVSGNWARQGVATR